MAPSSRCLEYAGIDPEWEKRELQRFSSGAIRHASAVTSFLLGRLLEEDLHVSCKPMLPPHIHQLNKSVLQGACILQVVDVVNIGANFEHRTEDTKGATRTLKFCLTDGHQNVFGFEFAWLPRLSVKTPRGTKIVVRNVVVRHGMLLLTPDSCHLLGEAPAAEPTVAAVASTTKPAGAYSAALLTNNAPDAPAFQAPGKPSSQAPEKDTRSQIPQPVMTSHRREPPNRPVSASITSTSNPPVAGHSTPSDRRNPGTVPTSRTTPGVVNPPVFVDISSEEDEFGSDRTDPMVEHLFYSPNTPRLPKPPAEHVSRKRPHPDSVRSPAYQPHVPARDVVDITDSPPKASRTNDSGPSFSILSPPQAMMPSTPIDMRQPFVYLQARNAMVAATDIPLGSTMRIRAFMKSVAGFQFNTGVYNLRVQIEDCTATKEVQVDPVLAWSLMGVPCREFQESMQTSPAVAHRLAAKMQVKLMTMQGLMTLRLDARPDKWTLLECRDYTPSDTSALLARIRALS